MKWIQELWVKFMIQIVTVVTLWVTYYVFRHLVPKKYRLHDSTIKRFLRDFGFIAGNITKNEDGIGETLQKSKNLFDYFYDIRARQQNTEYEFKLFVRDLTEEVTVHSNATFVTMILPRIESLGKTYSVHEIDAQHHCVRIEFEDLETKRPINLYLISVTNGQSDRVTYYANFACTKGFKYQTLTNHLFNLYENRLYLTVKHDILHAEKLDQEYNQKDYMVPETLFNNLRDEITSFKEKGIQRSYILYGAPGTGKTSFSLELSKQVCGKILKLDAKVFSDLASHQTKMIIEGLDCDFIIVDDIDRIMVSDLSGFLYMLESLKDFKNKPTLLATINTMKRMDPAILRPGRFDDIIEFNLPNEKQRATFFKDMMAKHGQTPTAVQLKELAKATDNMSHAFLKEFCLQLMIESNIDLVITKIKRRQKYLKELGDESRYEQDYSQDDEELSDTDEDS